MSPASPRCSALLRVAVATAAATVLCLGLVGCRPEPIVSPTESPSSSPSLSPSALPAPTETPVAGADIELPTACEQLYSPPMLASLQERAPLNDPEVTMTSTQNAGALEILSSGIPTIRCSWGAPSETGLSTNVSIVDAAQSAAVLDALIGAGFACGSGEGGTVCSFAQTMINLEDELAELTETHVLRGNGWVATATINFEAAGYTEDIVATLWG